MDARVFLDEFRPFRRGEIALARRATEDPYFLGKRDLECLRYVLRFAQLSSIGAKPDQLVDRITALYQRAYPRFEPGTESRHTIVRRIETAFATGNDHFRDAVRAVVLLLDGQRREGRDPGLDGG